MAPLEAARVPSAESARGQGSPEQAELPIGENLSHDLSGTQASNNQAELNGGFFASMAGKDSEDQISSVLQPSIQPIQSLNEWCTRLQRFLF
jgi:hypothetical protein